MVLDITYLGHSGFCVQVDDYLLIFDYFEGDFPIGKIKNAKKPVIFVSHEHPDHFNETIFTASKVNSNTQFILSDDIKPETKIDDKKVKFVSKDEEINLRPLNIKTFDSSDTGVCFLVELNGAKIFHAGDLNLWSWQNESTAAEIDQAKTDYYRILNDILRETHGMDVVFFPLDTRMKGYFQEGAVRFLENFKIKHFFPMHMWGKYRKVKVLEEYNSEETTIYPVSNKIKNFNIEIGD